MLEASSTCISVIHLGKIRTTYKADCVEETQVMIHTWVTNALLKDTAEKISFVISFFSAACNFTQHTVS